MSNRYKGAVISATPPTTTGGESGTASGAWTLEQQMQLQAAGLWPAQPTGPYIEQVFSTYLYTGNGSTQTITNGIDLSTKGGLVWYKDRTTAYEHQLVDTVRGAGYNLETPNTSAQASRPTALTAFNTTGFTLGSNAAANGSGDNFVSWTFREQPKFFDVVTYTGNGTAGRTVAHNLGSVPGCMIVKRTDASNGWAVYHRAMHPSPQDYMMRLNATDAAFTTTRWNNTLPTSTEFTLSDNDEVNGSGATYVAYLFAHNAGGFGLTGTDNVISCGTYSGTGAANNITLGYEPQWVMVKRTDSTADWVIMDAMRSGFLEPNTSDAESGGSWFSLSGDNFFPTATGFQINTAGPAWNASGGSYIYIAIRRGPMRVPTSGTSVFIPTIRTDSGSTSTISSGFPPDLVVDMSRSSYSYPTWEDRLRGNTRALYSNVTDAEATFNYVQFNSGSGSSSYQILSQTGGPINFVDYAFKRAPGFFDEVCYTGNGTAGRTVAHNLGVAPELMIVKCRSNAANWPVYPNDRLKYIFMNETAAAVTSDAAWNNTAPTASVFSLGTFSNTNEAGFTYVNYLFATCPGVSKVGSYTGTATTLQIDCGFTAGSRFVLIKRTDSTGDWYVWDSARGIVAGNDPYLLLNSTAAEVTNTDYVDTYNAGFEISSTAPAAINASGGTYIFLAIA